MYILVFFRKLIINGGDIEACSKFVEDSINNALLFLDEDVMESPTSLIQKHCITDVDIKEYKPKGKELKQKIKNDSDIRILLDSYYVKNKIIKKDAICFVTTDKNDIVDETEYIKGILDGVHIRDPSVNPL